MTPPTAEHLLGPLARVCRPLPAAAVLLSVYVALSFAMSPGGYLGTDTGAKVATLDHMVEEASWQPDLGYWAEDLDPSGHLHPIYDSRRIDGGWVHVTTLPMLLLGRPLYAIGGYRLALLLPMLGAIGAAFAARSLARRATGGDQDDDVGWTAFWVVGVTSPLVIYALDFWEHAPGVACMVGAVALLALILTGDRRPGWAVVAGALLGLAATMRTEAFVYALVAVGLACVLELGSSRSIRAPVQIGALSLVGFAGPWIANMLLEQWIGGNDRGARVALASGGGGGGGGHDLGARLHEAATTMLAVRTFDGAEIVGGVFAVALAGAVVFSRSRDGRVRTILLGVAACIQLLAVLSGLDFVPGMLVAAPMAIAGLVRWPPADCRGARYALAVAVGSLPLVWAFQFIGGSRPQWAGRYALASCILLVALGVAALHRSADRIARLSVVGLSAVVTISGVFWLSQRSHAVGDYFGALADRPEDVLIVRNGFFIREGGAAYAGEHWLTAVTAQDLHDAVFVVRRAGFDTFGVLDGEADAPRDLDGATLTSTAALPILGSALYLHSYELR